MQDYGLNEQWVYLSTKERMVFEDYRNQIVKRIVQLQKELYQYDKDLKEINTILGVE